MKSTVETLSPTRVRLAIEVPFAELEPSLKKAYREIGSQVRVPGFRQGKVPSAVIDQRVGRGAVLNEAVQDAIPENIVAAVREHDVKSLGRPEVEITDFADGAPLKFTAELDVRPEITVPDLDAIEVTVDDLQIADSEIDEQVDALRQRFATLKTVERPAAVGDYVQLDLAATVDGEEVPGGSATNISHEIGSQQLLPGPRRGAAWPRGQRVDHVRHSARRRRSGRQGRGRRGDRTHGQGKGAAGARRRVRADGQRIRHAG